MFPFMQKMLSFQRSFSVSPFPILSLQLPSPMETHLWFVVPDEFKSVSLLNQYMELLSPCEKENVLSMRGEQLQKRALLARTLVRTTIARCLIISICGSATLFVAFMLLWHYGFTNAAFLRDVICLFVLLAMDPFQIICANPAAIKSKIRRETMKYLRTINNRVVDPRSLKFKRNVHWKSFVGDQINNRVVDPRSLKFKRNVHGKPELEWESDGCQCPSPLHFNMSHTTSLIACGMTVNSSIGIDIEEKQRKIKNNILAFSRRYFSLHEVEHLSAISDSEVQRQEFVKLWTLKEAYVKALGRGFSAAPFKTFTICIKNGFRRGFDHADDLESRLGGYNMSIIEFFFYQDIHVHGNTLLDSGLLTLSVIFLGKPMIDGSFKFCNQASEVVFESSDHPERLTNNWQFGLFELVSSHYAAVCMEKDKTSDDAGMSVPIRLTVRKTIPFVEDECISGTDAVVPIAGLIEQF
ncbi:hypothetical protein SADUNF_Sadunf06G0166100 [Salix dunnii]|uniref:holo-[acyl-carrier-protein] synthase n=1 Tax=Salix dunnii TaxID=1413687 RepID=A0A835K0K2_9ROSI|nr:hypothetical protein SADUNF_Sadunf06G0166100 [Salix dunnii]